MPRNRYINNFLILLPYYDYSLSIFVGYLFHSYVAFYYSCDTRNDFLTFAAELKKLPEKLKESWRRAVGLMMASDNETGRIFLYVT